MQGYHMNMTKRYLTASLSCYPSKIHDEQKIR